MVLLTFIFWRSDLDPQNSSVILHVAPGVYQHVCNRAVFVFDDGVSIVGVLICEPLLNIGICVVGECWQIGVTFWTAIPVLLFRFHHDPFRVIICSIFINIIPHYVEWMIGGGAVWESCWTVTEQIYEVTYLHIGCNSWIVSHKSSGSKCNGLHHYVIAGVKTERA